MGPPGLAGPPGESGREVRSLHPLASDGAGLLGLCLTSFLRLSLTSPNSLYRDPLVLKAPLEEMALLAPR